MTTLPHDVLVARPHHAEDCGQQDQAVKQPEHANHEEDLEKGGGDVTLGGDQEGHGQQGGEAAIEDSGGDVLHHVEHLLL